MTGSNENEKQTTLDNIVQVEPSKNTLNSTNKDVDDVGKTNEFVSNTTPFGHNKLTIEVGEKEQSVDPIKIQPSRLQLFEQLEECPQYLSLSQSDNEQYRKEVKEKYGKNNWSESFFDLSKLLEKDGNKYEQQVMLEYEDLFGTIIDGENDGDGFSKQRLFIEKLITDASEQPAYDSNGEKGEIKCVEQLWLKGQISVVDISGMADIVIIWPLEDDGVHIRVIDVKSSFKEQTYQQMQVGMYTLLLSAVVENTKNINSDNVTITGGIHYRETEIDGTEPDDLPKFDLEPRENELKELCKYDGTLHKHSKKPNDQHDWQLNDKCLQCRWSEACGRNSISTLDTSILGITRGEQQILSDHGIETVYDLAGLAIVPYDQSGNPTEQFTFEPRDSWAEEKMSQLLKDSSIAPKLKHLIQKSRTIIHNIHNGQHEFASESNYEWLVGSGRANLPHDEYLDDDSPIENGSMIRVYLTIQRDHRRDVVTMVNGAVTSSLHYDYEDNDPITFSHLPEKIGDTVEEARDQERELLDTSVKNIFDAIQTVGEETGLTNAPIHFYFYTETEETELVEGLKRHDDIQHVSAFRDLLGLRNNVDGHMDDQSIASFIQSEIERRFALGVPYYSLLPVWRQLHPNPQGEFDYPSVKFVDYSQASINGKQVNLMQSFRQKLFGDSDNYKLKKNGQGVELINHSEDGIGNIETISRGGATIPLEYIWGVCEGGITEEWYSDDKDEDDWTIPIDSYLYHGENEGRITKDELKHLGELFALTVAHIERSIVYKNKFEEEKKPITLNTLSEFDLGESSLTRSCREFIELEHNSGIKDSRKHYGKDIQERIRSGKSTYVGVQNIESVGDNTYHVSGRLMYEYDSLWMDDDDESNGWEAIAEACRIKDGGDDKDKGDYLIANEIDMSNGNPTHTSVNSIGEIESGSSVRVIDINLDKNEQSGVHPSITFEVKTRGGFSGGKFSGRYTKKPKVSQMKHKPNASPPKKDNNAVLFQPNGTYVLDPGTSNVVAQNHYELLDSVEHTTIESLLVGLANGTIKNPTTDIFDQQSVNSFVETLSDEIVESPNRKQRDFIKQTDAQLSLLQGPPGTGKTSGALSPTLLSRVYSFDREREPFRGLVSAPSNTAVKEVMSDLDELLEEMKDVYPEMVDRTSVVRLVGNDENNPFKNCDYVNMSEDGSKSQAELFGKLSGNHTLDEGIEHLIVFSTPYRHKKLFDDLGGENGASGLAEMGTTVFDLLAVDEASMLRLPAFINLGAFLHNDAQVLISGDHRQMPPVLKHNWENETRRTITEIGPYLSTLNYLRYLDQEETLDVSDDYVDEIQASQTADLSMVRLERTYRCHQCVAGFLRKHLYDKYDGINYNSNITKTIDQPPSVTDGVDAALRPDGPLTLIIHDDLTNNQSSSTEVDIVEALSNPLKDVLDTDADESPIGVVTPHNAQKALLNKRLPNPLIDTVERFQGGDKKAIMVSATVSDPDSLKNEEDFILNPNRLNVAMSRMEEKLIVIVPKSIFRLTPKDTDDFKRSLLWKFLYREVDAFHDNHDWSGTLTEFTDGNISNESNENTNVSVYTLDADHFE